jgi:hypothetical protein
MRQNGILLAQPCCPDTALGTPMPRSSNVSVMLMAGISMIPHNGCPYHKPNNNKLHVPLEAVLKTGIQSIMLSEA